MPSHSVRLRERFGPRLGICVRPVREATVSVRALARRVRRSPGIWSPSKRLFIEKSATCAIPGRARQSLFRQSPRQTTLRRCSSFQKPISSDSTMRISECSFCDEGQGVCSAPMKAPLRPWSMAVPNRVVSRGANISPFALSATQSSITPRTGHFVVDFPLRPQAAYRERLNR